MSGKYIVPIQLPHLFKKPENNPEEGYYKVYFRDGKLKKLNHLGIEQDITNNNAETDPVFLASPAAGITTTNISEWTQAFNWGDHSAAGYLKAVDAAGLYAPIVHTHQWSEITNKPTTLAGYGITDSVVLTTSSYANPSWITSLAFSKITGYSVPNLAEVTSAGNSTTNSITVGGLTSSAAITANYGTLNRTAQLRDNGLYISRLSDGTYVSFIIAQGNMTYGTRNSHIFQNDGTTTMILTSDTRNVLINTTVDAGYKFDVNGTSRVTGTATFDGLVNVGSVLTANALVVNSNIQIGNVAAIQGQGRFGSNSFSLDASAQLELISTTRGFLTTRMTTAQRDAIVSPTAGLSIYNTTTNKHNYFNGTSWVEFGDAITGYITGSGTTNYLAKFSSAGVLTSSLIFDDGTNVGIGGTPVYKFDVYGTGRFQGTLNARDILPASTNTYTLGSGSSRWTSIYAFSIYGSGSLLSLTANASNQGIRIYDSGQSSGIVYITDSGYSTDDSTVLKLISTTRGFLQPKMTSTQRDAIYNPSSGLSVYNTTTNKPNYYNGTGWIESGDLVSSGSYANPSWITSLAWSKITGAPAFLTAEADTLDTVTGRGATTTNAITVGGLIVATNKLVVFPTTGNVGINTLIDAGFELDVVGGDVRLNGVRIGLGNGSKSANMAIGFEALNANSTGIGITAIGYQAFKNGDISYNTAIGYQSQINGGGQNNTSVGYLTLTAGIFGSSANTAIGHTALRYLYSGSNNTAIGSDAQQNLTTGSDNTSVGVTSLYFNTSGSRNSAFGVDALYSFTGSESVAFGYKAASNLTTPVGIIAIGTYALNSATTSPQNTAVGYQSQRYGNNATGQNTSVGYNTFSNASFNGNRNTAVGALAGVALTTGNTNAFFGYLAGTAVVGGSNNTLIGSSAGSTLSAGSNNTLVGALTVTTGSSNAILGTGASASTFSACVVLGREAIATGSNQFVVGSTTYPAGTVTAAVAPVINEYWTVKINGVDKKIALIA